MLAYVRETAHAKCEGLTDEQSGQAPLATSPLTSIGGFVNHLRWVEHSWFETVFLGEPDRGPWTDEEPDREMTLGAEGRSPPCSTATRAGPAHRRDHRRARPRRPRRADASRGPASHLALDRAAHDRGDGPAQRPPRHPARDGRRHRRLLAGATGGAGRLLLGVELGGPRRGSGPSRRTTRGATRRPAAARGSAGSSRRAARPSACAARRSRRPGRPGWPDRLADRDRDGHAAGEVPRVVLGEDPLRPPQHGRAPAAPRASAASRTAPVLKALSSNAPADRRLGEDADDLTGGEVRHRRVVRGVRRRPGRPRCGAAIASAGR